MLFSIVNNFYSISSNNYYIKQLLWYILGFILVFLIYKMNTNLIFKYSLYLYLFGNFLLLLTLLIGSYVNGARAWLNILGFSFQPSEFMKIFLILYLTHFTYKYNLSDFKYILLSGLIIIVPSILTFLEPDTGGVIIYLIIWITFLFLKKINKWYYIISIVISITLISTFFILYYFYQNIFIDIFGTNFFYRMDRITNFINQEGYQLNEALKNISNSGLFGIKEKVYFPESNTDFALTLLISNFGIVGLFIFLISYNLLFYLLGKLKSDTYILNSTLNILIFSYVANILMNIGLFPIIGITLPFLSYGGSSIISFMILLGFMLKEKASFDTYL